LVAEENGKLLGHIMLTRTYINDSENKYEALLLASVSVIIDY